MEAIIRNSVCTQEGEDAVSVLLRHALCPTPLSNIPNNIALRPLGQLSDWSGASNMCCLVCVVSANAYIDSIVGLGESQQCVSYSLAPAFPIARWGWMFYPRSLGTYEYISGTRWDTVFRLSGVYRTSLYTDIYIIITYIINKIYRHS